MSEIERILMECRYLLSLNKSVNDLAKKINVTEEIIYDDLYNKLPKYDHLLYERVLKNTNIYHNI